MDVIQILYNDMLSSSAKNTATPSLNPLSASASATASATAAASLKTLIRSAYASASASATPTLKTLASSIKSSTPYVAVKQAITNLFPVVFNSFVFLTFTNACLLTAVVYAFTVYSEQSSVIKEQADRVKELEERILSLEEDAEKRDDDSIQAFEAYENSLLTLQSAQNGLRQDFIDFRNEFALDPTVCQTWVGYIAKLTAYGTVDIIVKITNTQVFTARDNVNWLTDDSLSSKRARDEYMHELLCYSSSSANKKVTKPECMSLECNEWNGKIRVTVTWGTPSRFYSIEDAIKKYPITWEKKLLAA
jgi:hypothetical protein